MTVKLLLLLATSFYLLSSITTRDAEPAPTVREVYRPYMKEKVREMGLRNETDCLKSDITVTLLEIGLAQSE